jgi:hypothetical protein
MRALAVPGGAAPIGAEGEHARVAGRTGRLVARPSRRQGRDRFESRRIHVGDQTSGGRLALEQPSRGEPFERHRHASHHVRARLMTRLRQDGGRLTRQLVQRLAVRGEQLAQIRHLAGKLRRLRLPEPGAGGEHAVECVAVPPVQLVDHPGRDGRPGQRLHLGRRRLVPLLLQLGRERIPRRRELGERQLEQRVYLGIPGRQE